MLITQSSTSAQSARVHVVFMWETIKHSAVLWIEWNRRLQNYSQALSLLALNFISF